MYCQRKAQGSISMRKVRFNKTLFSQYNVNVLYAPILFASLLTLQTRI